MTTLTRYKRDCTTNQRLQFSLSRDGRSLLTPSTDGFVLRHDLTQVDGNTVPERLGPFASVVNSVSYHPHVDHLFAVGTGERIYSPAFVEEDDDSDDDSDDNNDDDGGGGGDDDINGDTPVTEETVDYVIELRNALSLWQETVPTTANVPVEQINQQTVTTILESETTVVEQQMKNCINNETIIVEQQIEKQTDNETIIVEQQTKQTEINEPMQEDVNNQIQSESFDQEQQQDQKQQQDQEQQQSQLEQQPSQEQQQPSQAHQQPSQEQSQQPSQEQQPSQKQQQQQPSQEQQPSQKQQQQPSQEQQEQQQQQQLQQEQ